MLSPQQQAAVAFIQRNHDPQNAILRAVAGSGKTTTLVEMTRTIPIGRTAILLAFNKKIADELKLRLRGTHRGIQAGTFHAMGLRRWTSANPLVEVDKDKIEKLMVEFSIPKLQRTFIKRLLGFARQGITDPTDTDVLNAIIDHYDLEDFLYSEESSTEELRPEALANAQRIFSASNDSCSQFVDFDDMLYAPLFFDTPAFEYDYVFLDEAQDTNDVRRAHARDMYGGRLVAVGDPNQSIYGFAGATDSAMDLISDEFNCIELPLTVSFRCSRAVVERAQQLVPEIEAAEWAREGVVRKSNIIAFDTEVHPGDAILCRNTKPLIELALSYLRRHIPAHVEGRDIGESLLVLVRKWRKPRTVGDFLDVLQDYEDREIDKFRKRDMAHKIGPLKDRTDSIRAIASSLKHDDHLEKLEDTITSLFADSGKGSQQRITLSTIHKAKGLEWPRVFLYGPDRYMPSSYATADWELQQERNLEYVAVTRAQEELVEVLLDGGDDD